MFTDSHCHLSFPELQAKLPEILSAMQQAQVTRALCISCTMEEFPDVHALALGHDNLWCTVGVHPDTEDMTEPSVQDLLERAALPRVVGIGETGLDYYGMETARAAARLPIWNGSASAFAPTSAPPRPAASRWSSTPARRRPTRWLS